MNKRIKIVTITIVILIVGLFSTLTLAGNKQQLEKDRYEKEVSIVIRTLKDVFEPNEPVPLIVAIANHSSKPVYTYGSEQTIYESSCTVCDANGIRNIRSDELPENRGFPSDYSMFKDGKWNLVLPVYKIDSYGVMLTIVSDSIKLYRKNMPEGKYCIGPYFDDILYDVNDNDIIIREDVTHRLWIDPVKAKTKRYESNTAKIEIRKKSESKKEPVIQIQTKPLTPLAETRLFSLPAFSVGAAVGFCALGLILMVIKKTKSHQP